MGQLTNLLKLLLNEKDKEDSRLIEAEKQRAKVSKKLLPYFEKLGVWDGGGYIRFDFEGLICRKELLSICGAEGVFRVSMRAKYYKERREYIYINVNRHGDILDKLSDESILLICMIQKISDELGNAFEKTKSVWKEATTLALLLKDL
jgi:hypothetical protein